MMSDSVRYPRVSLVVPHEQVDWASGELFSAGALGIEERDDSTLVRTRQPGKVTLVASFDSNAAAQHALSSLPQAWQAVRDDVDADDWQDTWKKLTRPFYLTPHVLVRPSWESSPAPEGVESLVLEPGRAFGSGTHPTTGLVATVIERHVPLFQGKPVLDVGCGSGLLALCALLHGASEAVAIDNDPSAVRETIENAERNGLLDRVRASDTDVSLVEGQFPLVMANIQAAILIGMKDALMARVAPGGLLVLSGVLEEQVREVSEAFSHQMSVQAITQRYEWVAMELLFRSS